ncbi:MAG: hypothetical protein M0D57_04650 [Sphingobacteriales bacterium JAD_PAG50586_3]|nr:MAG: hypothetical protein M0D57_04650 [Sphingobacteriales bacterium JAD_PAG50586_3]
MKPIFNYVLQTLRYLLPPIMLFLNIGIKNMHVLEAVSIFTTKAAIVHEFQLIVIIVSVIKLAEMLDLLDKKAELMLIVLDWLLALLSLGSTIYLRISEKISNGEFVALIVLFVAFVLVSIITHRAFNNRSKRK